MNMDGYNLTKEEIETAIIRYLIENRNILTMNNQYNIRFIIEDTYQKDSLTGYYKPEFVGAEVTVKENS